jgi:hypothetical protein
LLPCHQVEEWFNELCDEAISGQWFNLDSEKSRVALALTPKLQKDQAHLKDHNHFNLPCPFELGMIKQISLIKLALHLHLDLTPFSSSNHWFSTLHSAPQTIGSPTIYAPDSSRYSVNIYFNDLIYKICLIKRPNSWDHSYLPIGCRNPIVDLPLTQSA